MLLLPKLRRSSGNGKGQKQDWSPYAEISRRCFAHVEESARLAEELKNSKQFKNLFESTGESAQSRFEGILAGWIGRDMRPASIVRDPGFAQAIAFANSAQEPLSVPSRQTIMNRVQRKASASRMSLRVTLARDDECTFFSISSDIWTSIKCESYISFTIHYVDVYFNMKSWTLEVRLIPGKHDGDSIACALSDCFSWWRLDPKKCVRFLRDGASNITSACSKLGLTHRSCAAHSLHLVVAAALMMKSEERTSKVAVDADGTVISDTAQASSISTDVSGIDCVLNTSESHLAHYSWIDERLEALENCADDGDELDEFVRAADIDSIFAQVAAFVADVEKVVASEVSSIDMESARQSVCNFRSLAEYFHRSQKGSNRLNHCQLSRKEPLKVKIDCPTRWNSTLDMLQRFVELQSALKDFFTYLLSVNGRKEFNDAASKKLSLPSSEQWFTIQCLIELLAPFSVATKKLDGETYPTLVSLHLVISSLKIMLSDRSMFDALYASVEKESFALRVFSTMQSVRRSFLALLSKRFDTDKDKDLLWISLLDPYVTNSLLFTDEEFAMTKSNFVREMIPVMRERAAGDVRNRSGPQCQEEQLNNSIDRAKQQLKKLLYIRRMGKQGATTDNEIAVACELEFSSYIRLSCEAEVAVDQEKPPSALSWWREHHSSFPTIAPLARKWLGCIATSVPSERAFSTAGNTVTKRRSSLKADTVRDILFMAGNFSV